MGFTKYDQSEVYYKESIPKCPCPVQPGCRINKSVRGIFSPAYKKIVQRSLRGGSTREASGWFTNSFPDPPLKTAE